MAENTDAVVDAMEELLTRFEEDDDVAHAEVGGVVREHADVVVTEEGVRSALDLSESGIWCRVFAGGAAEYRYTTTLEADHLADIAERVIRAGRQLGQRVPARYDPTAVHRATHEGWARGGRSVTDRDAVDKAAVVEGALTDAVDSVDVDRARANYADEHAEVMLMTTTGTTLRTAIDRASVDATIDPADGPKQSGHAGATTGLAFLDEIPGTLAEIAERVATAADSDRVGAVPTGSRSVALSPAAAGQLLHEVSHYFEMDAVYLGSSPFAPGDTVGPAALRIEDGVRAGSWAARAFDAEGRPTQPIAVVSDGVLENRFHNTASAADADVVPHGHSIPSLGFEHPPRIHARHLDVAPGTADAGEIRADADLYVERFGPARLANEATRTKRQSGMPATVQYARDIEEMTPTEFDAEAAEQGIDFPIESGYVLDDGERAGLVDGGTVTLDPRDLLGIDAIGTRRETTTGVCTKHKSHLPWAVTAPSFRLTVDLRAD